jgi:DNA polymerase-3 subunit gamma/tau
MSYISFYRKWRPQSFDEIIGQEYNIKTIRNAVANDRLSHCYIFCGPRGTGKTSTARILAKALNCKKGITPEPCNKCENCLSISDGSNVDVIEIDAASNRGIDEIRELREKVKYLPSSLRKKVYIIDEVHMLTTEAFNALLKVLEEPPGHVMFIMATTEPNKVLPTIMSRCQRFDFYPIPMDKIKEKLVKIARSEKISISDQALNLISRYADGSSRDADGILEQLAAFGEDKIKVNDVTALLGIAELDTLFELTDILIEKDLSKALLLVNKILSSNQNIKVFVAEFIDHLYDLYVIKSYSDPFEVVNIGEDFKSRYKAQAEKLSKEELEFFMDIFTGLLKQIRWGEGSKVFFKSTVVKAVNFITAGENQVMEKSKLMEARISSLEEEVKRIRSSLEGKSSSRETAAGSGGSESRDDDFDIIKSNEIDEMVKDAEASGKSERSKKEVPSSDKNVSRKEEKSGEIDQIIDNLDEICLNIKKKKVPVYAMFTEASPYRVDNGTVYFLLDEKKQWHRDQLAKKANSELISGVIKEVTGRDYKVVFKTGRNEKGVSEESSKQDKVVDKKAGRAGHAAEGGKPDGDAGSTGKDKKSGSTKDVLNYFEKKFGIKE